MQLAAIAKPEKILPTTVEFVDIAGLVAGASQGEGLGNKFLAHIREVDAIAHVVRCFENADVVHVSGKIDPIADIEIIDTELALADLASVEKAVDRAVKAAKGGDKDAVRKRVLFERVKAHLDQAKPVRQMTADGGGKRDLHELHLLTAKPVMYVANVMENGFSDNPYLDAVAQRAASPKAPSSWRCARRSKRRSRSWKKRIAAEFLAELKLDEPGLNRVIRAAYRLLGLQTYFTAGPKEVRAWTVRRALDRATGRRRDPHGFRARVHPRRSDRLRGLHRGQGRGRRAGERQAAPRRQGIPGPRRRRDALPLQRLRSGASIIRVRRSRRIGDFT